MGFKESILKSVRPICGFANQPIEVKVEATLSVTLGDGQHTKTEMIEFLMVDHPSAYNAIFGRSIIRMEKMVATTFCLKLKFLTPTEKGYMRSNQCTTRQCHFACE
ncbi:hypothetical protein PVK06_010568 [Gossypium arboreum]|uniref:Uncharacterized protein n=1 Tax=Gossypium arboreum TaxID=29729 RepID=A0ABR0Q7D1_GOSAR|nr:hypothetical protein PVK06_010568 [Gossypium arboreum]